VVTASFDPLPGLGKWRFKDGLIRQLDPDQFFAKVLSPVVQTGQLRYSFAARSLGKGWVGLGLHLLVGKGTHRGYGEGTSWLVWLTRDPVHFKKDATRIQVYHSTSDVAMDLVSEAPVAVSVFDWNRFEVELDPQARTLVVRLNTAEVLTVKAAQGLGGGNFVALRTIDQAEFKDYLVEAKP
jgi:hypothetical protein